MIIATEAEESSCCRGSGQSGPANPRRRTVRCLSNWGGELLTAEKSIRGRSYLCELQRYICTCMSEYITILYFTYDPADRLLISLAVNPSSV